MTHTPLQEVILDIVADGEIDPEAQSLLVSYANLVKLIKLAGLENIEHVFALLEAEAGTPHVTPIVPGMFVLHGKKT